MYDPGNAEFVFISIAMRQSRAMLKMFLNERFLSGRKGERLGNSFQAVEIQKNASICILFCDNP